MIYSIFLITILFILQSTLVNAKTPINIFSVMGYNVENLFDTLHDEGKDDYEMLPLLLKQGQFVSEINTACAKYAADRVNDCLSSNWSEKAYQTKIKNLVSIIGSYKKIGADIVVLPEVENIRVMKDLLKEAQKFGYRYADILEDSDLRGIDVGILTKYPIANKKLLRPANTKAIKRGLYQYDIAIGNKKVIILGNHWPSMNNDIESRKLMASFFIQATRSIDKNTTVISLGDFNSKDDEVPNIINDVLLTHYDARQEATKLGVKIFPGSHKHKGQWGILDRILIRKNIATVNTAIKPIYESFEVIVNHKLVAPWPVDFANIYFKTVNPKIDLETLVPLRFDEQSGKGYSDHLPIAMEFRIN